MATQSSGRVLFFGLGEDNDLQALDIKEHGPDGASFILRMGKGERQVHTRLVGRPGVYATLAAVAVARELEHNLDDVVARLAALAPVDGRMRPVLLPSGALLLCDDKNSSEASIRSALDAFASVPATRKIVVMGEIFEPQGKAGPLYRSIGEQIGRVADAAVLLVGRHRVSPLRAGAQAAGMQPSDIHPVGHDIVKATDLLRTELGNGDVALIKGRGTEHLERIQLGLLGQTIRCTLPLCKVPEMRCGRCPQLSIGPPP
jgi:UDP-N-acetylmuramyl pentapeptide synthase